MVDLALRVEMGNVDIGGWELLLERGIRCLRGFKRIRWVERLEDGLEREGRWGIAQDRVVLTQEGWERLLVKNSPVRDVRRHSGMKIDERHAPAV